MNATQTSRKKRMWITKGRNVGSHERGRLSLILDTQVPGTLEEQGADRKKPKEREEEEEREGEASAVVSWITQRPWRGNGHW